MPNYEYLCTCGHKFELVQKIVDRNLPCSKPCPSCNKLGGVVLQIAPVAVVDPVRIGRIKPKQEFIDVLKNIKKNVPNNKIDV